MLLFIASSPPSCQSAYYCKVKWLTDFKGPVHLNYKNTFSPLTPTGVVCRLLCQVLRYQPQRFLAPPPILQVNGILFLVLKASETLQRSRFLRLIQRPHSQQVVEPVESWRSCQKEKSQVHFIYSGHNHKFASKGISNLYNTSSTFHQTVHRIRKVQTKTGGLWISLWNQDSFWLYNKSYVMHPFSCVILWMSSNTSDYRLQCKAHLVGVSQFRF